MEEKEFLYFCQIATCKNRIRLKEDYYCPECRDKMTSGMYQMFICTKCGRIIAFQERESKEVYIESLCEDCRQRLKNTKK